MVTPEFISAWEGRMRWLYALLARLEAQPERLVIDLQMRAVHRTLWRMYRQRDAILDACPSSRQPGTPAMTAPGETDGPH